MEKEKAPGFKRKTNPFSFRKRESLGFTQREKYFGFYPERKTENKTSLRMENYGWKEDYKKPAGRGEKT
ncbi:MAG: hypothetical protein HYW05_05165 [Candidatus Diapherotrites archaeon]|nr:hypothetical protein [Candidatus Diapherotrites archaeon]